MADVNVLDLTEATPASSDDFIMFDRSTGEAKSTRFGELNDTILNSKFGDSSPTNGDEMTYNSQTGKWKNTSQLRTLVTAFDALGLSVVNGKLCVTYTI